MGSRGPPVPGEVEQPSSEAGRPPRSPLTVVSCDQQDVGGTILGISAWAVFPPGPGPSCDRVFFLSSISPMGLRVLWDGQDGALLVRSTGVLVGRASWRLPCPKSRAAATQPSMPGWGLWVLGPTWATKQEGACFSQVSLRSDDEGEDDEDEDEEEEEEEGEEDEEEEEEEEEEEQEPHQEEQGEESSTPSRKVPGPNSGVSPAGQSPALGPGALRRLPGGWGWGCLGHRTADSLCCALPCGKEETTPAQLHLSVFNPSADVSVHL